MVPSLASNNQLQKLAKEMIFKGSKSFSLASLFFSKEEQAAVHMLYAWCRYTDDVIDESESGQKSSVIEKLENLRRETRLAFEGKASGHSVFFGLQAVVQKYKIPQIYAEELLNGYQMDIEKKQYQNTQDLDLYCYRVAGVVGLMMCHIMGLSDVSALERASRMGMAMQMTNIARDVKSDYEIGRVYLPQNWLLEAGVNPRSLLDVASEPKLHQVVTRLVLRAEVFYQDADAGLYSLPLRAAFAVAGARWIYSEIGRRVIRNGPAALRERTVISFGSKLWLLGKGLVAVLSQFPTRLRKPFRRIEIDQIWRPQ